MHVIAGMPVDSPLRPCVAYIYLEDGDAGNGLGKFERDDDRGREFDSWQTQGATATGYNQELSPFALTTVS